MNIRSVMVLIGMSAILRCTDHSPNPVGSSLFQRTDRGSEHFLRFTAVSDTTYSADVNNGTGSRLLAGWAGRTEAWSLVKFPMPISNTVDSASLILTVSGFSGFSSSTVHLAISRAAFVWNETDWAGSDSQVLDAPLSIQITPQIDSTVNIQLPPEWIASWTDTVTNQGLLIRSAETDGLISFFSREATGGPQLSLRVTVDTTQVDSVLSASGDTFIATCPETPPSDRLWIADGIGYRSFFVFKVDSIPVKAVINRATFRVTAEASASSDTLGVYAFAPNASTWPPASTTSDTIISGDITGSGAIEVRSLVQSWVTGRANDGLSVWGQGESMDLKRSVLYRASSDSSRRPLLEVYYSLPPENRF
jgi:hypothetical protein